MLQLYPLLPKPSSGYKRVTELIQDKKRYANQIRDIVVTHDELEFYTTTVMYDHLLVGEAVVINNFFLSVGGMAGQFDFFDLVTSPWPWTYINVGTAVSGGGIQTFQLPAKNCVDITVYVDEIFTSYLSLDSLGDNGRNRITIPSESDGVVTVNFSGYYAFKSSFLSPKVPFDIDGFQYHDINSIRMQSLRNDRSES